MTTVSVTAETRNELKKFKEALTKVAGKKFNYDDAVNFLMDCFLELADCLQEKGKDSSLETLLRTKKELVEEVLKIERKPLTESFHNFFYVPDSVLEKIKKEAEKRKVGLAFFYLQVLEEGIETAGKTYFLLEEEQQERVNKLFSQLSESDGKKVKKELEKTFNTVFKLKLKELEKKYGRKR
jgi:hypothetical protein